MTTTTATTTANDQKDHIDPRVPEIEVADGVEVPKLPKWVPEWALAYGNGNIPISKMTLVDRALKASGAGYLEGTLSQHYAFREITEVATFLTERSKRPVLPNALKEKVIFNL